jgi:hypothetical protein
MTYIPIISTRNTCNGLILTRTEDEVYVRIGTFTADALPEDAVPTTEITLV